MPRHIAIIMDGNGRWAKQRFLPRVAGHRRGLETVRRIARCCVERGVEYLTLFAFSSENWRRPADEVSFLMQLFMRALGEEVDKLHENGIRFKVVGDLTRFEPRLVALIREAEALTAANTRLTLTIAANYGGRWDILQAVNRMLQEHPGPRRPGSRAHLAPYLALAFAPEPDLFIRTGGEQRISNFCSGSSPIPSSTSPTRCGRTSTPPRSTRRSPRTGSASGASAAPASSSCSGPRLRVPRRAFRRSRAEPRGQLAGACSRSAFSPWRYCCRCFWPRCFCCRTCTGGSLTGCVLGLAGSSGAGSPATWRQRAGPTLRCW